MYVSSSTICPDMNSCADQDNQDFEVEENRQRRPVGERSRVGVEGWNGETEDEVQHVDCLSIRCACTYLHAYFKLEIIALVIIQLIDPPLSHETFTWNHSEKIIYLHITGRLQCRWRFATARLRGSAHRLSILPGPA